jgi:hypothetical protein
MTEGWPTILSRSHDNRRTRLDIRAPLPLDTFGDYEVCVRASDCVTYVNSTSSYRGFRHEFPATLVRYHVY